MPTYEYRCERGHSFDVVARIADDPVTVCEVCGRPVQRVLQPVAVHFKGSGFYNTDYGTRKRQRETAASKEGVSSASSSSDSSSDSKSTSESSSASSDSGSSSSSSKSTESKDKPAASKDKAPAAKKP